MTTLTEMRLDRLFAEVDDLVPLDEMELLTPSTVHGVVPQSSLGMRPQQALREGYVVSRAQPGDFVISMSSHAHGIEYCGVTGGISPDYTLLRPKCEPALIPFLKYALKSKPIIHQLGVFKTGVRMGLRLQWSKVRYCKISIPDTKFASAAAMYLNDETMRIDGLIEKKRRFIDLLREKRASAITVCVTKGLGDSNDIQSSGIKSIGDVPSHWSLNPIGRVLRQKKRIVGKKHGNFKLLSLTTRGVIERDTSDNSGKFPESFDTYQEVHPGQFVFCLFDMDETPRTVGRSEFDGMITGAYTVFDCIEADYARYLLYLFLHLDGCKGLKPFYTGLRKTIRPTKFTSIKIPFPPPAEAAAIAQHLDEQTARIDRLITKTERSIELLREHRSALITAAVTGKIDVRALIDQKAAA